MKITVEKMEITKEEMEVEFPLFLQSGDIFDNGAGYKTFRRIDENGNKITLTEHSLHGGHLQYEFSVDKIDIRTRLSEYLLSEYLDSKTAEKEFLLMLQKMTELMSTFVTEK